MKTMLRGLSACLLLGAVLSCRAQGQRSASPSSTAFEAGGSNYVAFYVSPDYLRGCGDCPLPHNNSNAQWLAWSRSLFLPGKFRHVVGDYHLDPATVRQQLRELFGQGQRKITLIMHLVRDERDCMDLSWPDPNVCETTHRYDAADGGAWGFALPLDSTNQLRTQHQENLRQVVRDIKEVGFNQVNVRFMAYGELDPKGWRDGAERPWDNYHEFLYRRYWTAVQGAIDIVNRETRDSIKVLYDLNAEQAAFIRTVDGVHWGSPNSSVGHVGVHTRRLWKAYLDRYGNTRTVGFSYGNRIINPRGRDWQRETITVMNRDVYDSVGARPFAHAFDIYPNQPGPVSGLQDCKYPCFDAFFREIARQIRPDSLHPPQIIVWEALYNNRDFARAIRYALSTLRLHIPYIMQWPVRGDGSDFSEPLPKEFTQYQSVDPQ